MHGEDPLHTDAVRDLAHGEGRPGAAALHGDHHTLEDLDAVLLTFLDFHVHLHRVTHPEGGRGPLHLFLLDQLHEIHGASPPLPCWVSVPASPTPCRERGASGGRVVCGPSLRGLGSCATRRFFRGCPTAKPRGPC